MPYSYRNLQSWDHWLSQSRIGQRLLEMEKQAVKELLSNHFGKHAMLLGVPAQKALLDTVMMPFHSLLTPLTTNINGVGLIEGHYKELALASDSLDVVMLPHTLEFVENPHRLLNEAARIVKPNGLVVITGFNQYSFWGAKKILSAKQKLPWSNHYLNIKEIKSWLDLADVQLESQQYLMYRPPVAGEVAYNKLGFMEKVGKYVMPQMGGVYCIAARAKVMPMTPIRLRLKQKLSNIRISRSVTGYITREQPKAK